ncbi:MAG: hypothetical protein R3B06_21760 [Kofleriaceae bacterium]
MRSSLVVASLVVGIPLAAAQPVDPYADDAPAPVVDRDLDDAVATGLRDRAAQLIAADDLAGARMLLTEALARRPSPAVEDGVTALLAEVDAKLAARLPPTVPLPIPRGPIEDAQVPLPRPLEDAPPSVAPQRGAGRRVMAGYGVAAGLAVGAAIAGDGTEVVGAGIAGAAGGLIGFGLARRLDLDRTRAHLIGSGVVWGGVAGGLFADVVTGLDSPTTHQTLAGAAVGSLAGGALALALPVDGLTSGDVAVIDAGAGFGVLAGFQVGLVMDPPTREAYMLNATLGALGGYLIGHLAARRLDASPGRVAKVSAVGVAGAAAPWLLWLAANDDTTRTDEQVVGLLSIVGLGGGLYLGARWTHDDRSVGGADDAPLALWRRRADGGWALGGPAVAPAASGRGATLTVVAGAW